MESISQKWLLKTHQGYKSGPSGVKNNFGYSRHALGKIARCHAPHRNPKTVYNGYYFKANYSLLQASDHKSSTCLTVSSILKHDESTVLASCAAISGALALLRSRSSRAQTGSAHV